MAFLDDLCRAVGAIGRCLFEAVATVFKFIIEFFADVVSWAHDLVHRCWNKIKEGWRMYYVDIDVEKIPPTVIPRERLAGAKKVSLGIMTDENMNPKRIDKAFVHSTEDNALREQLGNGGVVELVL